MCTWTRTEFKVTVMTDKRTRQMDTCLDFASCTVVMAAEMQTRECKCLSIVIKIGSYALRLIMSENPSVYPTDTVSHPEGPDLFFEDFSFVRISDPLVPAALAINRP